MPSYWGGRVTSEQRMLRAIARGVPNPQQLAQFALDHPDHRLTELCARWRERIAGEQDGGIRGVVTWLLNDIDKALARDETG